ncbi:MAG: hypothetical protein ABIG89_07230 [Candidatus Woesearchaeota archaeon]
MVNETLVKFINEHVSQGYTMPEIKEYLIKYGFKAKDIDESIDYFYQKQQNAQGYQQNAQGYHQKSQPNQQLVRYVHDNLAKGYTIEQIRNYLLQYGYDHGLIEQAIQAAEPQQKHVRHIIEIHPKTIAHIFVILLLIGGILGGGYFLIGLFGDNGTPELLDYAIQIDNTDIKPSEKLYFVNKITNMGDKRRYDIFIEFRIINKESLEELTSWSKTFAIDVVVDKPESVLIPPNAAPGKYTLHGTVYYGDITNKASNTFKVLSTGTTESCFDGIINQDEEGKDCGGKCQPCESCYDGKQNQNEEGVDCGGVCKNCETCYDNKKNQDEEEIDCGGICNIPCKEEKKEDEQEVKEQNVIDEQDKEYETNADGEKQSTVEQLVSAKEMAGANPDKAVQLCKEISISSLKDSCITDVAKKSEQSKYCAEIEIDKKRDPCYMYFVTNKKDYLLCGKITNDLYKDSCLNLKKLSVLQDTYGVGEEKSKTAASTQISQSTQQPTTQTGQQQLQSPELIQQPQTQPAQQPEQPNQQQPNELTQQQPNEPNQQPSQLIQQQPQQVIFSNINSIKLGFTKFKITWVTNIPVKSIIKYGNYQSLLGNTAYDAKEVTQHELILDELKPKRTYYYQPVSMDAQGNVQGGEVMSFETKI